MFFWSFNYFEQWTTTLFIKYDFTYDYLASTNVLYWFFGRNGEWSLWQYWPLSSSSFLLPLHSNSFSKLVSLITIVIKNNFTMVCWYFPFVDLLNGHDIICKCKTGYRWYSTFLFQQNLFYNRQIPKMVDYEYFTLFPSKIHIRLS